MIGRRDNRRIKQRVQTYVLIVESAMPGRYLNPVYWQNKVARPVDASTNLSFIACAQWNITSSCALVMIRLRLITAGPQCIRSGIHEEKIARSIYFFQNLKALVIQYV